MALTNLDFCEQAGLLAKNAAAWASDSLTLRERVNEPMDESALRRFLVYVRGRLASLETRAGLTPLWRHKKRGTYYTVVADATAQASTRRIVDGDKVRIYVGDDGQMWVRRIEEFEDGRFERVEE